jgi:thiol:disulfide interchange protein DsbA
MRSFARYSLSFALAFLVVLATPAQALEAGKDYVKLPRAQAVDTGAKIEVLEFFWYGCGHCYELEPALNAWAKRLPKDVAFRRAPAVPSPRWASLAQTFFTLDAMGELNRMHPKVFDAIHKQGVNLNDPTTQLAWMTKQGVDDKKFQAAWASFSVQTNMRRAIQVTEAYQADSVPVVYVDGKYMASLSLAGSEKKFFAILDQLVAKARAERGK